MPNAPFDQPSQVDPIEGQVSLRGPGAATAALTPGAARETAARLEAAADRAQSGHVARIDIDDEAAVRSWAERLGVDDNAVRNAIAAVGPDCEAVALRLTSARGAAD